jgi:hypothetical protein
MFFMDKDGLKSYVDAMRQAGDIFVKRKPDYILAPMLGSVPFIDAMHIVNPDFDPSKVVYMPASSRILDVNKVIEGWYFNFLRDKASSIEGFPTIMGIDEVVSGASVIRCIKHIDLATGRWRKHLRQSLVQRLHTKNALVSEDAINKADLLTDNQYATDFALLRDRVRRGVYNDNRHAELARRDSEFFVEKVKGALERVLVYKTVGVEDSKKQDGGRVGAYRSLREAGRVEPVQVMSILGMDNPDLCPVRLEVLPDGVRVDERGYVKFSPRIERFNITSKYLDFLRTLANYVGADQSKANPINMGKILDSKSYLPVEGEVKF